MSYRNDDTNVEINYELSIFKKNGEIRGHFESIPLPHEEYCQVRMYVLQNYEEVWPFIKICPGSIEDEVEKVFPMDQRVTQVVKVLALHIKQDMAFHLDHFNCNLRKCLPTLLLNIAMQG
ncbi:uncharacterized protein LOC114757516 [Neltuma alba]|uniref:uncharacterized protein LOC114757516 n=1 Tax=Neltuma alba TaxID=207710 RepID=UPI0010A53046|nr:uncharacterized protein LOC114757516 [Prosopis alba]